MIELSSNYWEVVHQKIVLQQVFFSFPNINELKLAYREETKKKIEDNS